MDALVNIQRPVSGKRQFDSPMIMVANNEGPLLGIEQSDLPMTKDVEGGAYQGTTIA